MAKKTNKKVSIIIPVFNVEDYLHKSIDSAVQQTLSEIEIILVNDASQDNSQKIIDHYKEIDDRIISIQLKENVGQGYARNQGLQVAKGEFVYFLDGDDHFASLSALEEIYAKTKIFPECEVLLGYRERSDTHLFNQKTAIDQSSLPGDTEVPFQLTDFPEVLATGFSIRTFHSSLIKRSLLRDKHIVFKLSRYAEDYLFFLEVLSEAKSCVLVDVRMITQVRREGSSTAILIEPRQVDDLLKSHRMAFDFINNKFGDEGKKRYLLNILGYRLKKRFLNEQRKAIFQWRGLDKKKFVYWKNFLNLIRLYDCDPNWQSKNKKFNKHLEFDNQNKRDLYNVLTLLSKRGTDYQIYEFLRSDAKYNIVQFMPTPLTMSFSNLRIFLQGSPKSQLPTLKQYFSQTLLKEKKLREHQVHKLSKKPVIWIHMGTPKTASSFFQKLATSAQKELLKQRILYTKSPTSSTARHVGLFRASTNTRYNELTHLFDQICEHHQKIDKVVLSCEDAAEVMTQYGNEYADWIKETFSGFKVKIMILLRRQDEWLEAMYKECVGNNYYRYTCNFKTFSKEQDLMQLDYKGFVDRIAFHFGKENIKIYPYKKFPQRDGILEYYADAFELNFDSLALPDIGFLGSRESYDTIYVEPLRQILSHLHGERRPTTAVLNFVRTLYSSQPKACQKYVLMSFDERKSILNKYRAGNDELASEYLGKKKLFDDDLSFYRDCLQINQNEEVSIHPKVVGTIMSRVAKSQPIRKTEELNNPNLSIRDKILLSILMPVVSIIKGEKTARRFGRDPRIFLINRKSRVFRGVGRVLFP
ncbi:MAG: glycosyltransferase family 2 protein [Paracoccaceae bacterium]